LFLAKDKYGCIAWHRAAQNGNLWALETLWIWSKGAEINRNELLLAQTGEGFTASQLAAENKNIEILKGLCFWAEEAQLNPNELQKNLLLVKKSMGILRDTMLQASTF